MAKIQYEFHKGPEAMGRFLEVLEKSYPERAEQLRKSLESGPKATGILARVRFEQGISGGVLEPDGCCNIITEENMSSSLPEKYTLVEWI